MKFKLYALILVSVLTGCNDSDDQSSNSSTPSNLPAANNSTYNNPTQQQDMVTECIYAGEFEELYYFYEKIPRLVNMMFGRSAQGCPAAKGESDSIEIYLNNVEGFYQRLQGQQNCYREASMMGQRIEQAKAKKFERDLFWNSAACMFLNDPFKK